MLIRENLTYQVSYSKIKRFDNHDFDDNLMILSSKNFYVHTMQPFVTLLLLKTLKCLVKFIL